MQQTLGAFKLVKKPDWVDEMAVELLNQGLNRDSLAEHLWSVYRMGHNTGIIKLAGQLRDEQPIKVGWSAPNGEDQQ